MAKIDNVNEKFHGVKHVTYKLVTSTINELEKYWEMRGLSLLLLRNTRLTY